jgi:ribosomal protein S14
MLFLEKWIGKMNKNIRNILKERIIRVNLSKSELFRKILKSVSQNNNINNNIKIYINYLFTKNIKRNFFLSRRHKICLITGKRSSILKGFSFSRYIVKNLILNNKATNIKKHNW